MLIEFRVANFRSFRERQVLSMVAGSSAEHRDTHTLEAPGSEKAIRVLASAALYGPNAAGKTNLLKALQCMQTIVVNSATAPPTAPLAYAPFKFDIMTHNSPTEFEIVFLQDGVRYEYSFSLDADRIHREQLIEFRTRYPRRLFERSFDQQKNEYVWKFSVGFRGNRSVWRDATRQNALFLSTAVQLNNTQLLPAFAWFQRRLVTIVGATQMNFTLTLQMLAEPDGRSRLLPFVREADFEISDVQVATQPLSVQTIAAIQDPLPLIYQEAPNSLPKVAKVTFSHTAKESQLPVGLDLVEESGGAQVLFRTGGAWLNVLKNGEVLLIDEIDTSLHPFLIKFLIDRFHSRVTNQQNAQLVFTTHNTSILNKEMFRRDQIWFVEKGMDGTSKLYPLSDFSPRKEEDFQRWYMRGKYGALPILEELDP
jgi:AAA15 family ATPase/GTPase